MTDEIQAWLATAPALVREIQQRWELGVGAPYEGGSCAWVAPAALPDGRPAVLKISWPHAEAAAEAEALRLWDGRGAVRVLRHDPERWAILLERCEPGTKLGEASELPAGKRLQIGAQVLRTLWTVRPPGQTGIPKLGDVLAEWADLTEERMDRLRPGFDPGLVRLGTKLLRDLPATAAREVVVHGDFNPGNVLTAERAPWLAIDPKPMVGDPGYDPWPLIEQIDPAPRGTCGAVPTTALLVKDRFVMVADVVGEDAERLVAWAVARCIEDALWTVEQIGHREGEELVAKAGVLTGLLS